MAFVGMFNFQNVVGHHWNSNMWGGVHPRKCMGVPERDEKIVETIRANRDVYTKPLKVAWGVQNWTLESNKCNQAKEMNAISKYHDSKIIHGRCISIFINFPFFLHCLHLNIGI